MAELCIRCDKKSLPGLKKGSGLCQYHFDEYMYGTKWADKLALSRALPSRIVLDAREPFIKFGEDMDDNTREDYMAELQHGDGGDGEE